MLLALGKPQDRQEIREQPAFSGRKEKGTKEGVAGGISYHVPSECCGQ